MVLRFGAGFRFLALVRVILRPRVAFRVRAGVRPRVVFRARTVFRPRAGFLAFVARLVLLAAALRVVFEVCVPTDRDRGLRFTVLRALDGFIFLVLAERERVRVFDALRFRLTWDAFAIAFAVAGDF